MPFNVNFITCLLRRVINNESVVTDVSYNLLEKLDVVVFLQRETKKAFTRGEELIKIVWC